MTVRASPPLCAWCKHLNPRESWRTPVTCKAFPEEEIPTEIYGDEGFIGHDHRQPHPDDHGIQFELLNDFAALKRREWFRNSSSMENLLRLLDEVLKFLDLLHTNRNYEA